MSQVVVYILCTNFRVTTENIPVYRLYPTKTTQKVR